jgi:hypothetical protein
MTKLYGRVLFLGFSVAVAIQYPRSTLADENGISFWLPGMFGSLAALPQQPGWALGDVYYHTSVSASGAVAAAREVTAGRLNTTAAVSLNVQLDVRADTNMLVPTYVFATPVLGGQLALSMLPALVIFIRKPPCGGTPASIVT